METANVYSRGEITPRDRCRVGALESRGNASRRLTASYRLSNFAAGFHPQVFRGCASKKAREWPRGSDNSSTERLTAACNIRATFATSASEFPHHEKGTRSVTRRRRGSRRLIGSTPSAFSHRPIAKTDSRRSPLERLSLICPLVDRDSQ